VQALLPRLHQFHAQMGALAQRQHGTQKHQPQKQQQRQLFRAREAGAEAVTGHHVGEHQHDDQR
jgi:hypothetical protein